MSTDAKKPKLFAGDEKEDWKIFYDDAIRSERNKSVTHRQATRTLDTHTGPGPPMTADRKAKHDGA